MALTVGQSDSLEQPCGFFFPLSSTPNYRTGQGGRDRNAYFVQNIKKLILDDQEIE